MDARELKAEAARIALGHVESGMRLGIGTGSTAEEFIRVLGAKVGEGLKIVGVPTSERTASLCRALGIPLSNLDETPELDLVVDGADEFDPALNLIKGGGGALLREKIVATAASRMIVIADASKRVEALGRFPLPIEVNIFGRRATEIAIRRAAEELGLSGELKLREKDGEPYLTDGGHQILDASFGRIPDPRALSLSLHAIPGVVEHGLFLDLADAVILASDAGVETIGTIR
ncbi:ribose-5-phosphate isomerase RpiA [Mesorhizobium sp. RP14(2022)]|uniref:Ribose-5-phosphate isomerase A n=1 Tax=Mesorhizobium liriopis TaxID=2953882 RepID=A0ABT1C1I0_9HYPH|nr:ribose-5-phosphate isomerase RpiA [Mesorhizobium liriopis]MCO6048689.1 ribose-5-phosphate isomerase RpiA [Mesorhizobium liriopis]